MKYKLTEEMVEDRVVEAVYFHHGVLTVCALLMENGFFHVGQSACMDPKTYDKDIGKEMAYEDAFRKAWSYEAYLMKEYEWEDNLDVPEECTNSL